MQIKLHVLRKVEGSRALVGNSLDLVKVYTTSTTRSAATVIKPAVDEIQPRNLFPAHAQKGGDQDFGTADTSAASSSISNSILPTAPSDAVPVSPLMLITLQGFPYDLRQPQDLRRVEHHRRPWLYAL